MAGLAEAMGVFFFTYCGQISTATYVLSKAEMGSIFQIGVGYAMGIVFAIVVCGTTSGGHFHPAITLAQVIFKASGKYSSFYTYVYNNEKLGIPCPESTILYCLPVTERLYRLFDGVRAMA